MKRLLLMMLMVSSARAAHAGGAVLIIATTPGEPPLDGLVADARTALAIAPGGVLAGAALTSAVDARIGPPPPRLTASALALLQARVKQAERNLFFNGARVRESIADLEEARARLVEAQASLAHDRDARSLLQYVLVKLTRAYQIERVPDAARLADERVEELVRLFPDKPLDAEHNERELYELYDRARKRLTATARLTVTLPPGAELHVEGVSYDAPPLLVPGAYRWFASDARGDGRLHRVTLDGATRVTIDLPLETTLRDQPSPSFVFASPQARAAEEPKLVARLGRALDASRVYVLGSTADATAAIAAYDVGAGERARLVAMVATREATPPLGRMAQRLVAEASTPPPGLPTTIFMNGHEKADPTRLTATSVRQMATPPVPAGARGLQIAGWTAVAAGVPAAVIGAALWPRSPGLRVGAPLVAAGGTLAVIGVDWVLVVAAMRGRRELRKSALAVAAVVAAGALASGLSQLH
jgi:hypothetical protein